MIEYGRRGRLCARRTGSPMSPNRGVNEFSLSAEWSVATSAARAFSPARVSASCEMSTPIARTAPGGQRVQRRRGMQPEPVHKSRSRAGELLVGDSLRESRRAQSSVSGRGMSTGGRVRSSRGPNGCVPTRNDKQMSCLAGKEEKKTEGESLADRECIEEALRERGGRPSTRGRRLCGGEFVAST